MTLILSFLAGAITFFLALGVIGLCLYAVPALIRLPIHIARLWTDRTTTERN